MSFPSKFTMKAIDSTKNADHEFVQCSSNINMYITFWRGKYDYYTEEQLKTWTTHKMIPFKYNGQDATGNPLNFGVDDLKPFMRCVDREQRTWIVTTPSENGKNYNLARNSNGWGFIRWYEEPTACNYETDYQIVKVYKTPKYIYDVLDPDCKGDLIWKRVDNTEQTEKEETLKQRLEYFSTHIDAVQENLDSLQKEYEVLKASI